MATAKSLTPAELERVLAYTATQPYAQRNRAMLMMTVSAGLRVSEVAGLTLGDVLDSTGSVRGEVYLASHRVKHGQQCFNVACCHFLACFQVGKSFSKSSR